MSHNPASRSLAAFTLIELMIVIAIIAVIAAIAIPGILAAQRASNERNAGTSLKTIAAAEADFRGNDRDGNKVQDYWTHDVAGFYTLNSWATEATTSKPIKLIELSMAAADADPNPGGAAGGNYNQITNYYIQQPKSRYWYYALINDNSAVPASLPYRNATLGVNNLGQPDNQVTKNTSHYGFLCFPDDRNAGLVVFVINESNTIFRQHLGDNVRQTTTIPPGPPTDLPGHGTINNYPSEADRRAYWVKLD